MGTVALADFDLGTGILNNCNSHFIHLFQVIILLLIFIG